MVASGGGSIVNMSSVNGVLTIPNISSYNVSKGGVNQLTRVMALALADKNIRVNAVAPGTIATELAAKAVLTSDEAKNKIMSRTPMKRLGEPSEIADVVAWLASDAASYVTGEIVTVDGGRIATDAEGQTSLPRVWAGGDCRVGGRDLTVEAVEHGKVAAVSIHAALMA